MPELPDVEIFRRRIRRYGLNRRVTAVDLRDPASLRGASEGELESAMRGHAFQVVRRHGKVLFVQLGRNRWLVMHFGMTGFLAFYVERGDEPKHARLVLKFEDGGWFAFADQRRLGWLELIERVPSYLRAHDLGPDALGIDEAALRSLLAEKRGMVKTALMDQEKLAGIGNVYSDEILFHAGVRPDRKVDALSESQIETIHSRMHSVLNAAVKHGADPEKMPRSWLTPHRGTDDPCPRCGSAMSVRKVGGRSAYFCGECQR